MTRSGLAENQNFGDNNLGSLDTIAFNEDSY